jgi:hypothetical protein
MSHTPNNGNINFDTLIAISAIPLLTYDDFSERITGLLKDDARHCMAYYAVDTR